jgi:hypothetical protein
MTKDLKVFQVIQDPQEHKDLQVLLGQQVQQAQSLDLQAPQEQQVLRVYKVLRERKALLVLQERLVLRVLLVLQEQQGLQVLLVLQVQQVLLALMEQSVLLVRQAHRVQ